MYKIWKEFFEQNNLKIENNCAYGVFNEYEVNYTVLNPIIIHIAFYAAEEQKNTIANEIKLIADKNTKYEFDKFGVALSVTNLYSTVGKMVEKTTKLSEDIIGILKNSGALGAGHCPICGVYTTEQNSHMRNIDGLHVTIDDDCANSINEMITRQNLEFDNAPNNYFKGFLGALIGGVAGAVIAIILNIIGFYAGLSSFVAFIVGVLLYQKFGGKPNKMMIVIVTATTFVMMILAVMSIYLFIAGVAATEAGVSLNAFEAFAVCMKEEEFARMFYADLAMTLLFTVVGCVSEIVKTARNIKRSKNIN